MQVEPILTFTEVGSEAGIVCKVREELAKWEGQRCDIVSQVQEPGQAMPHLSAGVGVPEPIIKSSVLAAATKKMSQKALNQRGCPEISQWVGPRLFYPLATLVDCVRAPEHLSFQNPLSKIEDKDERLSHLSNFCMPFLVGVQHPFQHFTLLDAHLSTLLPDATTGHPSVHTTTPTSSGRRPSHQERVNDILHRLPSLPQRLFSLPFNSKRLPTGQGTMWDRISGGIWDPRYLAAGADPLIELQQPPSDDAESILQRLTNLQDYTWSHLYVTAFIDTNSIVFTTKIAFLDNRPDLEFARQFQQYVNILAEMIDVFENLSDAAAFELEDRFDDPDPSVQAMKAALFPEVDEGHHQGRAVVKVFLWTVWQRSVMLYFYYIIGVQLRQGYSPEWSDFFAIRGIVRLDSLDAETYRHPCTEYMCSWAFELLRVSSRTLAVSHVWAHGQGGRPESGINECLHKRYFSLASNFHCDSYWIDSACVPSDAGLRKEAISTINDVFATCDVVLVSDADLQSVDITSTSVDSLETLLSVLLVCDWNVRAWTMLEAMRGNRSIHLLCKDDHTIPLMTLLQRVHSGGAIDLAVLLGSTQHLLPSVDPTQAQRVEDAGYLLSQRYASHPADELRIWSLLNNKIPSTDPLKFWKAQSEVRTAFLMSSAPRVNSKGTSGFGWAPATPRIVLQSRSVSLPRTSEENLSQSYTVRYPSYDGSSSYVARITEKGLLVGKWLARDIDYELLSAYRQDFCDSNMAQAEQVYGEDYRNIDNHLTTDVEVYGLPDTAGACEIIAALLANSYKVRLLRPLQGDGNAAYGGGENRGDAWGYIAALCCVRAGADEWEWKGVYQWSEESLVPEWKIEEMVII
ncbi:hypothetical protein H2201_008320 [Coniosporium apollinis]|uniref:Heterokaryon incompatibility domain-containing protein n=1 Tax=Coniosporium apollinis TaxID=61459 RepID=A0ABQ9NJ04_9PEZI|nr:hypothetical protein H2201_008320 [Coniosporium apollinis]